MNSNKTFDLYKNAKYFVLADLILVLAGIVIMCIFGFNVSSTQGAHLVLQGTLTVLISLLLVLLYVGLRYSFSKALAVVLIAFHNILLSTALICLIRVPVAETLTMSYALTIGLSVVFGLVLIEKTDKIDFKKADINEEIKASLNKNFKLILVFTIIVVAVMLLSIIFANNQIFDFAREMFVMTVVVLYSTFILMLPTYFFIAKRTKKRRKTIVDTSVENQKVVKATTLEQPEEEIKQADPVEQNE